MSEKENFSRIQALDRLRERIQIFIKHDPLGHLKSIQKSSARLYNAAKGIVLEYIDKSLRARALHLFPQNLRSASTSEIFDAFEEAERSLQPLRDYLRKMGAELSDPAFDPATNLERRL